MNAQEFQDIITLLRTPGLGRLHGLRANRFDLSRCQDLGTRQSALDALISSRL